MTYELNKELLKKDSKEIETTLLLMIFADSIDGVAIEDDNGEDQHLTQEDLMHLSAFASYKMLRDLGYPNEAIVELLRDCATGNTKSTAINEIMSLIWKCRELLRDGNIKE